MPELLGRTNQAFPSIWLRPSIPGDPAEIPTLIEAVQESHLPIDVTSQPALWGGLMRGSTATLICRSSLDYARATDETHATYLTQAHLIETLSCVGREHFDFYFLRVRDAVDEFQISGALQALELARQEGHIRFIGLACDGSAMATLGQWQFHDAFEALLVRRNPVETDAYDTLSALARERRVGIVTENPVRWRHGLAFPDLLDSALPAHVVPTLIAQYAAEHPTIVDVSSAEEVQQLQNLPTPDPEGIALLLAPYIAAANEDAVWQSFAASESQQRKAAFSRWKVA